LSLFSKPSRHQLPSLDEIDIQVKSNLRWTLATFSHHKLGSHHFAAVTGYGHGDLGREILDAIFAAVMGAGVAVVRLQDELLAVAGTPYDILQEQGNSSDHKNNHRMIWSFI